MRFSYRGGPENRKECFLKDPKEQYRFTRGLFPLLQIQREKGSLSNERFQKSHCDIWILCI